MSGTANGNGRDVSVLFNEPKLLKCVVTAPTVASPEVSVLFNEPKLLKSSACVSITNPPNRFSALQRAEIAEIAIRYESKLKSIESFSALQRAEIAEIETL